MLRLFYRFPSNRPIGFSLCTVILDSRTNRVWGQQQSAAFGSLGVVLVRSSGAVVNTPITITKTTRAKPLHNQWIAQIELLQPTTSGVDSRQAKTLP